MTEIGWAGLGIVPTFDKFGSELNKGTSKAMLASGVTGGRVFGDQAGRTAGSRFGSAFKTAAKAGLVGLGVLGAGAFKLGKDSVAAASDLAESTNKVRQVFGKNADDIFRFSSRAGDALGQTNQQARDAAATFGIFGKAAKLSDKDNAQFSTRLTKLASDLASFSNTTPEQAIEAIGSALRGESEPIRSYGVLLDEATLKAEALRLGLLEPIKDQSKIKAYQVAIMEGQKAYNDAVEEFGPKSIEALKAQADLGLKQTALQKATEGTIPTLNAQQKVLAAQSSIFRQTGDAQGDFARTSDGLANQQRRLSARFEDAKAKLGQGLLPIVSKAADFLLDKGIPAFEKFADWFNKEGIPAIGNFADFVKDEVAPGFKDLKGFLGPIANRLLPDIKDAASEAKDAFKKLAPFVEDTFEAFDKLPEGVKKGLLIGGGALALKKFASGGSGGAAAIASGGVAGRIVNATKDRGAQLIADRLLRRFQEPLPVIVVNQGKSGGTYVGADGKDKNGSRKGGGVAKGLGLSAAIPFAGVAIDNLFNNFTDGKNSKLLDQYDAEQKKARALSGALGDVAKARTGIADSAKAVAELDRIYAGITMRDPGRGLDKFEAMLNDSELSADDLRKMLPNTAREIDKAGGVAKVAGKRTDYWRTTLREVQKVEPRVTITTPGLEKAISRTETYKGLVESFDGASIRVKGTSGGRFLKGLASGGPVQRGQTYLVGENGPELFRSSEAGRITPNHQTTTHNPVNFNGPIYVQNGADLMRRADRARRGPALGGRR